jgi:hypothetical protein
MVLKGGDGMNSIPKTRSGAITAVLVYTISALMVLIFVSFLLGADIDLKEFVIIGVILVVVNTVFQFYLYSKV